MRMERVKVCEGQTKVEIEKVSVALKIAGVGTWPVGDAGASRRGQMPDVVGRSMVQMRLDMAKSKLLESELFIALPSRQARKLACQSR